MINIHAILSAHDNILEKMNARSQGTLPGLIGIEFTAIEPGHATSRLALRPELLAPNGYLHAAVDHCHRGYYLRLRDLHRPARRSAEFHHHRAQEQLFGHRARRHACLRCNVRAWRPYHPDLGCAGDGRNQQEDHRVVPLYTVDHLSACEVICMMQDKRTPRFFLGVSLLAPDAHHGVDNLFGVCGHGGGYYLTFVHEGNEEKTPRDIYRSFTFFGCQFEIRIAKAGLIWAGRKHQ